MINNMIVAMNKLFQKKCLLSKKKDKKVGLSHHTARMKNKLQNSNMSH